MILLFLYFLGKITMAPTGTLLGLAIVSAISVPSLAASFGTGYAMSPVGAPFSGGAPAGGAAGPAFGPPGGSAFGPPGGSGFPGFPGAGGGAVPGMTMPSDPSCPPTNGMVPLYVPDPDDCTKYTVCSGGFGMQLDCPPGLHFNRNSNHCDYPPIAGCEERTDREYLAAASWACWTAPFLIFISYFCCVKTKATQKTTAMGYPTLLFVVFVGTLAVSVTSAAMFASPGGPPANPPPPGIGGSPCCPPTDGMVPLYVPDPDDCTKYTVCSAGFGMKMDCPPGLHFNKVSNHCDFPPLAGCEVSA
ncbi:hypothetical protein HPB51_009079 [Rhipicephalus microplus]|uniref:Chitin-binding type-2 domain-containing protein n=1 Tax=Rhipicephalus microplus TaxID=6941 RepID=A0A9J6F032_RHIMP|nr:hypothetical protein HPB51_009079 [Rhipicephalus microplus]